MQDSALCPDMVPLYHSAAATVAAAAPFAITVPVARQTQKCKLGHGNLSQLQPSFF